MRILFLNLPYLFKISRASRWPEKTKSGTMYYPYWLCYAAGVCQQRGHAVTVCDCVAKTMDQQAVVDYVAAEQPDFVFAELTTPTCQYDYQTLTAIRQAYPQGKIVVGGTHATALPAQVLAECPAIDYVLMHEYDFSLPALVESTDPATVQGLAYHANGNCVLTPDAEWIEDLDSIPFVTKLYQQFLDVHDYRYAFALHPMIQLFSARGCPFRCNFCSYPQSMLGRCYRKRSIGNFVDELQYIQEHMPYIREIFIEDDTFTIDEQRVEAICDEILHRKLNLRWSCNARATLSYHTMEKMKQAGCRLLVVGYESGNQRVLDETAKGIKLEQSIAFAKNAKKLKLKVFGCFMIGLKGDDLSTIEETFQFARKVYPDMCFFQQAVPFPGTAFYDWVKQEGYLVTEDYSKWLNSQGYLACLVDYPYADHTQIEKIRDRFMSRYYFSFQYLFKTFLANLTWQEFKRVWHGGIAYIRFRIQKLRG